MQQIFEQSTTSKKERKRKKKEKKGENKVRINEQTVVLK